MSQDIFEIVQRMDITCVEMQIVLQCAPLIAGLKVSNLLNINSKNVEKVLHIIHDTQISYVILWQSEERTTLLLYIEESLRTYFSNDKVQQLLKKYGYKDMGLEPMLTVFRAHYAEYMTGQKQFPHEIGLFLGYPVEDVEGFINNQGKNSLYTGYWKVYGNKAAKIKIFEEFEVEKGTMIRLLSYGVSVRNIIVSYYNHHKLINQIQ